MPGTREPYSAIRMDAENTLIDFRIQSCRMLTELCQTSSMPHRYIEIMETINTINNQQSAIQFASSTDETLASIMRYLETTLRGISEYVEQCKQASRVANRNIRPDETQESSVLRQSRSQ